VGFLANRFRPAPPIPTTAFLDALPAVHANAAQRISAVEERPPRSHRGPPRPSRLLLLPACQMVQQPWWSRPRSVRWPLEIRGRCCGSRPAQSHGPRSLDVASSDGDVCSTGAAQDTAATRRPCRAGANGPLALHHCWLCPAGQRPGLRGPDSLWLRTDGLPGLVNHLPLRALFDRRWWERKCLAPGSIQSLQGPGGGRPAPTPWRIWPDLPTHCIWGTPPAAGLRGLAFRSRKPTAKPEAVQGAPDGGSSSATRGIV